MDEARKPSPWPDGALQPSRIAAWLEKSAHPYVTLKAAVTLDGRIATASGESKWITGEAARRHVHGLRGCHDGILVGIGTVEADDPQLNVRLEEAPGQSPAAPLTRVVLDSRCRIDPAARCLADDGQRRIVVCGAEADGQRAARLREMGVEVLQFDPARPAPDQFLPALRSCGIDRLLVEGGAGVHANMIALGQPNELFLYQAGKIIGGPDARGWCGTIGVDRLNEAPTLHLSGPILVGDDVLIHGVFARNT